MDEEQMLGQTKGLWCVGDECENYKAGCSFSLPPSGEGWREGRFNDEDGWVMDGDGTLIQTAEARRHRMPSFSRHVEAGAPEPFPLCGEGNAAAGQRDIRWSPQGSNP